jgi:hypothetical protein
MNGKIPEIKSVRGMHMAWPSAGKSALGWVFIVAGAIIAIATLGFPLVQFFNDHGIGGPIAALPTVFVIAAGGWLGAGAYWLLGAAFQSQKLNGVSASPQSVVACVKCGQKLRLPNTAAKIRVTCPSCKCQFQP